MSATLSLIDITGVAGVARSGHYCSRANKSATPLNIQLSVALRVALGLRRRCLADVAVRAAAAVTMAVAGYGPGRARPMGPLHAALRSASNCEKEATAEREARDTRSGLAP